VISEALWFAVCCLCMLQNALVPVLVRGQLSNHTVERLACGMAHVAVVATQRSKTNSGSDGTALTRLLTWGQNSAGQLGIGAGSQDHLMPTVGGGISIRPGLGGFRALGPEIVHP
jgi:hypothetical protein